MLVLDFGGLVAEQTHNDTIVHNDITAMCGARDALAFAFVGYLRGEVRNPTRFAEPVPTQQSAHRRRAVRGAAD